MCCFWLQFNFVGKLLGPKGNTLKRLQEETGCKMAILGKGSMRDKSKVCDICYHFGECKLIIQVHYQQRLSVYVQHCLVQPTIYPWQRLECCKFLDNVTQKVMFWMLNIARWVYLLSITIYATSMVSMPSVLSGGHNSIKNVKTKS